MLAIVNKYALKSEQGNTDDMNIKTGREIVKMHSDYQQKIRELEVAIDHWPIMTTARASCGTSWAGCATNWSPWKTPAFRRWNRWSLASRCLAASEQICDGGVRKGRRFLRGASVGLLDRLYNHELAFYDKSKSKPSG